MVVIKKFIEESIWEKSGTDMRGKTKKNETDRLGAR